MAAIRESLPRTLWFMAAAAVVAASLLLVRESPFGPDRVSAATLVVTTAVDADNNADGECSLREAIIAANNDANYNECIGAGAFGADSISFEAGLGPAISLTASLPFISDADGLTIDGGGDITVDGVDSFTPFDVLAGASLTLLNITLFQGAPHAVENSGTVSLTDVAIRESNSNFDGGGIFNDGTLTLLRSAVRDNTASDSGGGIVNIGGTVTLTDSFVTGNTAGDFGGGIHNENGTLTLEGSTVEDNTGFIGGGIQMFGGVVVIINSDIAQNIASGGPGGGINADGADVTISGGSTITFNEATFGGGIESAGSLVSIEGSTIAGNEAVSSGGGIRNAAAGILEITDSTLQANIALDSLISDGGGGAIHNSELGEVTITGSTLQGNVAEARGGGIHNTSSSVTLIDSTVIGNVAGLDGGGIFTRQSLVGNATLILTRTTVSGNEAITGSGGGIANEGDHVELTDSTVSGNFALQGAGGGISTLASLAQASTLIIDSSTISANQALQGGGIFIRSDTVEMTNSTVSGNQAGGGGGGGIFNLAGLLSLTNVTIAFNESSEVSQNSGIHNEGTTEAVNTIIAENIPVDCSGVITSLGNNLDSDDTCGLGAGGDILGGDADLGPLQNNGGFTETHALLSDSQAIDTGDNGDCPVDDQRGVERPQDGDENGSSICDIGAFEVEGPEDTPTPTATPLATATPTPEPASITIRKELVGVPGLNFDEFGFYGDLGDFTLARGESESFEVMPGEYEVVETVAAGFVLAQVDCDGGDVTTLAGGVEIEVEDGDEVECVFYNARPNVSGIGFGPPPAVPQAPAAATPVVAPITPPNTGSAGLR